MRVPNARILQAGRPFSHPTNSVKALKEESPIPYSRKKKNFLMKIRPQLFGEERVDVVYYHPGRCRGWLRYNERTCTFGYMQSVGHPPR